MTKTSEKIVIKYGGAAMQTTDLMTATLSNIALLKKSGYSPIVVHGGGIEISKLLIQLGIEPQFIQGLRVTDKATMDVVQMVLAGKVNKEIVRQLNREHVNAVGLSGFDAELFTAEKYNHPLGLDLGFVGAIAQVKPDIIEMLILHGYLPVIAPIALSANHEIYNINADHAATAIAIACQAKHLVYLTDVPGILRELNDPTSKIDAISSSEIEQMIANDQLRGGILPKIESALTAVRKGIPNVHILDGRIPHCLRHHFLENQHSGTTIVNK